jgi:hypothetical protein
MVRRVVSSVVLGVLVLAAAARAADPWLDVAGATARGRASTSYS